jgi:hypothetical protein
MGYCPVICKAVWGFVGEQEQNRIKELEGND